MASTPLPTSHKLFTVRSILGLGITLPVILIIFVAVGVAGASIFENMRFARATDQVLGLVAAARDYAAREKNSSLQTNEDVLGSLAHIGVLADTNKDSLGNSYILNAWDGPVFMKAISPTDMRMEMTVPPRNCRRLALVLSREAAILGLQIAEAHGGDSNIWRRFMGNDEGDNLDTHLLEVACGEVPGAVLALVFHLRPSSDQK